MKNTPLCLILLTFIFVVAIACKGKKTSEVETVVSEWTGKEMKFPSGYECSLAGKDTAVCSDLLRKDYSKKTIDIYCNVNASPIKLTISGSAIE